MSPLQDVMATTHQDQEQAPNLTFDDANTTEHVAKMAENKGS